MKVNYLRKIAFGLVLVFFTFSLCGCGLFGSGGNGDSLKPAVYISQSEISLAVGDSVQLSAVSTDGSAVTWESSNIAVATVDGGLVKGVAKGEAIIMVSTESVMSICTIKVNSAPVVAPPDKPDAETLVLSVANLSLEVGNSVTLVAESSIDGAEIIWDSTNKTVAAVSDGKVTALVVGKTTITANKIGRAHV